MGALDIFEAMEQKGIRPVGTLELVRGLLAFYLGDLSDKRLLDVGCGTSREARTVSRELVKFVGEMHGVDKYFGTWTLQDGDSTVVDGVRVHRKDAAEVDKLFPAEFFDGVVSTSFLNAPGVENYRQILEALYRVTKHDGIGIHYFYTTRHFPLSLTELKGIGYGVLNPFHRTHFDYQERRLADLDIAPPDDYETFERRHEALQGRLDRYKGDPSAMSTINNLFHTMILQKRD